MWQVPALSPIVISIVIAGLCTPPAPAEDSAPRSSPKASHDFGAVQSIFREHCIACHAADEPRGGLRLDSLSGTSRGGDTGLPMLDGSLETNEIYRRVSSADHASRMPKGKAPLSPAKIETIRQWVLAGCPWPDDSHSHSSPPAKAVGSWWDRFVLAALDRASAVELWLQRNHYPRSFLIVAIGLLASTLFVEQFRKRARRGLESTGWKRRLSLVTAGQFVAVWTVAAISFVLFQTRGHRDELLEANETLSAQVALLQSQQPNYARDFNKIWGDPPVPRRMTHPKALKRTYYRGNCERNDALFNQGNYCTAMFHLSLRTAGGQPLEFGQPLPGEDLAIHFELERAPGASPEFYTGPAIVDVVLSEEADYPKVAVEGPQRIALKVLRPNWLWGCDVPVTKSVSPDGWRTALLYFYKASSIHYAVKYEIHVQDGRIGSDSDVWMGCLSLMGNVQPPPSQGQIPLCEWFDWRPLPEINGPNSTDPKLLGIPD